MCKGILFIAPLGARNKKAAIFEEIVSQCPDSDYSSVLYITPAAFSLREAKRQFFSYLKTTYKKKVYIPFRSFTINSLCTNLYETYGKENIISDRIGPMVLCEMLGEKNIGYARLLSDLLSKIRHHILDKELSLVKEDIKSQIFEEKTMRRAVKAIEILEGYEKELKEKGLADFERAIKNSTPLIKEYVSPAMLVLDGFFDPTPLELEIVKTLIEKADKVYMLVEENAEFLKFFESFGTGIEKRGLEPSRRREGAGYYAYPSMEEEVEGIARGVKGLILEGIRPCEIVVSFPVLSKYLPMVKRVFQKHGIPVNIADYDLSSTKPFTALEEMITSIEDDYPRNEFAAFLTSAYFPGIPEILKEWAVSFSNKAGVVKGRQAWLSIKETLLNSTEEEISAVRRKDLDEFQRQIKQIINILEKLKQEKNLSSFVDEVEEVLNRFGFFDFLRESLAVPVRDVISNRINNVLSELRYFAELYNPPFSKGGQGGLSEFRIEKAGFYLKHLLKGLKGSDEDISGVRVVPFELAAGLESKAMFFGGMVESDLPSKPAIDPVLPEKVKKTVGLPFLEYYLDRQKRYFKRLVNASSDDPYFSYPMADGDKLFLPSPFLDWGMSLSPPVLNISTEEEILIREGAVKQRDFSKILWDGKLPRDKNVKSILMQRFGPKTFFRVTDIDTFRQCPLRFYIEKFLYLEIERPPKFEVEARLWGRLAHKTMEYLFKDGDIDLEIIDKKLFQGLEKSLREFPIGDFWSKVAREIFQRLLPVLKEQETGMRMQGFSPYMVEKTLKATINSLRLKGKIDRVDRRAQSPVPDGTGQSTDNRQRTMNNGRRSTVILLDYKTGYIDRDSLQLPLYACMWQKENVESVEKVGFYSLKDGRVDLYPKKSGMEEFRQNALQNAKELIKKMTEGIFAPISFKEGECRYCYHSNLCKTAK